MRLPTRHATKIHETASVVEAYERQAKAHALAVELYLADVTRGVRTERSAQRLRGEHARLTAVHATLLQNLGLSSGPADNNAHEGKEANE